MKLSNETRVGLLVIISFTIFIVLVGVLAKFNINRSGYSLRIYFSFLNDLRVSAPVKIGGGIRIGEVKEIKQSGEKTEVILWIENKYQLPKSSTFAIFTTGVIGEKYINVIVPAMNDNQGFLKDGDVKYGLDPASFDKMMQTFQSFMADKDGGEVLANIFQNSNMFVENLNGIVEENRYDINRSVLMTKAMIADLTVQSGTLMAQLNTITANMAELTQNNKQDMDITLKNLSQTTQSLNKIVYRLENGHGSLGKLMTDEEVYNNIRDASIYAKDLFYNLKQDPSKLFFRTRQ